jgi:tRNA pseudouridine55 synthase
VTRSGSTSGAATPRRDVDGVLLLDKPSGWTSNFALQRVKRLFAARKAGHTGSLDPLASGLLPLCLGEATKISAFLLDADKHYVVTGRLGVKTDTGDADGNVIARAAVPRLDRAVLLPILARMHGAIDQVPPMHSALKHEGRRLYELARAGVEVERAPRRVHIHALELLSVDGADVTLDLRCSKGTYVRTLIEDIAESLGSHGHVTALRRLGVGPYTHAGMVTVSDLEALAERGTAALDASLLPMDSAAAQWPALKLGADSAYYLLNGQAVLVPRAPSGGWVRLYTEDERFLGMGCIGDDGRVAPKRLIAAGARRRLLAGADND